MPSVSKKQANLMRAVAHSPSFAKKVGISQSVGKEFAAADKGKFMNPQARKFGGKVKKMAEGGSSSSSSSKAPSPQELEVIMARQREMDAKMNKAAADAAARRKAGGYKTGGKVKMCSGGTTRVKMASGGSTRGNGCATRGKTKGRFV